MSQSIDTPFAAIITELAEKLSGAQYVSLDYTSVGTGERALHLIQIGTDTSRIYRDDVATLEAMFPTLSGLPLEAAQSIHASLCVSLAGGIGDNPAFTKAGYYLPIVNGVKFNLDTGEVYVSGSAVSKRIIEEGVYKTVNSKPLTLAKKEIDKALKRSKLREYKVSLVNVAKMAGYTVMPETV
jgi:hypothetical protein